ncbi:MAG: hypothetical protein QOI06_228 [Nocardioidaceae bacterium]|jgi:hypothetical protein|nr:hypothetical protein [Nocardioidaceae bacterium]
MAHDFDPRTDDPAPDDESTLAADQAAKYARAVDSRAYTLRVEEDARAKVAAEKLRQSDFSGLYLNRADLRNLPQVEPLIADVLPRHTYCILSGRDHSFKSFTALDWGCCLATGKAWQHHVVEPIRVLYIVGEGAYGIANRIDAWEHYHEHPIDPDALTIRRTALNMHNPGPAFTDLLARIKAGSYGLVIIDTLRRVSGAADGNTSEMGAVVDNFDRVKASTTDGSVLVVAHTDKGDNDTRGYSGIEDDADVVWHAKRDEQRIELQNTKMKDGPGGLTLYLNAIPSERSIVLDTGAAIVDAQRFTEAQNRILETLRDQFPDGAFGGKLLTATKLPDSSYYRAAKELRQTGIIVNTGSKTRPFLELAETVDSQTLPYGETPPDQGDSHDSQALSERLPTLPLTPTTLRSGSGESREREQETKPCQDCNTPIPTHQTRCTPCTYTFAENNRGAAS